MSKLPGRNTVKTVIDKGIWIDADDNPHFSLPDLLQVAGMEDTEENRAIVTQMIREMMATQAPGVPIVERPTLND